MENNAADPNRILIVGNKDNKSERERCQDFSQSLLLESAVPPTAAQEVALRQVPILSLFFSLSLSLSALTLSTLFYFILQCNAMHCTLLDSRTLPYLFFS